MSAIISVSTLPLHSFLAVIGGIFSSCLLIQPKKKLVFLISILILLTAIFLNWSESFYSMYQEKETGSRFLEVSVSYLSLGSLGHLLNKGELCLINCNYRYSPIILIFCVTILIAFIKYKKDYLKWITIIIFINYLPNLGYLTIEFFKIDSLKPLNLYNFSFYMFVPISFLFFKIVKENKNSFIGKLPVLFFMFSMVYLISNKIDFSKKVFYENQRNIYAIENLINKDWEPKTFYRMVSTNPWDSFHPNFLWTYGIDTSDGYTNIINKNYHNFWVNGLHKKKLKVNEKFEYADGGDLFINYEYIGHGSKKFDLNTLVDLNLLRLINTGFIASYVPLKENGIKLVSGNIENYINSSFNLEVKKRDLDFYSNLIKERSKYIVNPKNILVYSLNDYTDRFFFPKKVKILQPNLDPKNKYRIISEGYEKILFF